HTRSYGDRSSDVCSSDLSAVDRGGRPARQCFRQQRNRILSSRATSRRPAHRGPATARHTLDRSEPGAMDTSLDEPRQATSADHQTILHLYKDASDWLHTKNTDQWARPWPSWEARDQRILASIAAGAQWLVGDGTDGVATITAHHRGDAALWTRRERRQ